MILFMHPYVANGRATAAIDISNLENIRVAFAFCSPKDQFSRKKGRLIAEGRLRAGVTHIEFAADPDIPIKAQVMNELAEDYVAGLYYFPNWANKGNYLSPLVGRL